MIQAMPLWDEVKVAWERADFRREPSELAPSALELLALFSAQASGGPNQRAIIDTFRVDPVILGTWMRSRYHIRQWDFIGKLLDSQAMREAHPDLIHGLHADHGFCELHPALLAGTLAAILFRGGAYPPDRPAAPAEIERVCRSFTTALYDHRWSDVMVFESERAWSDWFGDVAWDHSFLIVDSQQARLTIACFTDSD